MKNCIKDKFYLRFVETYMIHTRLVYHFLMEKEKLILRPPHTSLPNKASLTDKNQIKNQIHCYHNQLTEKLSPHPQTPFAFGLLNWKASLIPSRQ